MNMTRGWAIIHKDSGKIVEAIGSNGYNLLIYSTRETARKQLNGWISKKRYKIKKVRVYQDLKY